MAAQSMPADKTVRFPSVGDPNMLSVPQGMLEVQLEHKDITVSLYVLDLNVGDDQIALLLPATMRVEQMRMKSKFILSHDGSRYPVLYLGGNFEFLAASPKLRVLSFIRTQDKVPK